MSFRRLLERLSTVRSGRYVRSGTFTSWLSARSRLRSSTQCIRDGRLARRLLYKCASSSRGQLRNTFDTSVSALRPALRYVSDETSGRCSAGRLFPNTSSRDSPAHACSGEQSATQLCRTDRCFRCGHASTPASDVRLLLSALSAQSAGIPAANRRPASRFSVRSARTTEGKEPSTDSMALFARQRSSSPGMARSGPRTARRSSNVMASCFPARTAADPSPPPPPPRYASSNTPSAPPAAAPPTTPPATPPAPASPPLPAAAAAPPDSGGSTSRFCSTGMHDGWKNCSHSSRSICCLRSAAIRP
eukprot:Rhum_TRINITY_DN5087_c0_g1::Rhum_TRINITY_DN5087_c0_g1_i1::g.16288::m.16288